MARYINNFPTQLPPDRVYEVVAAIMKAEGFKLTTYKGEQVWKKGSGIMTQPQFVAAVFHDSMITVQAWIKIALLPGVYVGEMGLKGVYGLALKKLLKSRVERLETALAEENQNMQQKVYG